LSVDYRDFAYFNALPSFANPGAPGGFDEQSMDIRRRSLNAGLDLLPGGHFVPYLAFDHNAGSGSGIGTWVQDSNNEYAVPTLLSDSTENYRGGVRIEYSRVHLTLEEGGTTYKDDDRAYDATLLTGDRTTPIFGQKLDLSSLQEAYGFAATALTARHCSPLTWLLGSTSTASFFIANRRRIFTFSRPPPAISSTSASCSSIAASR